MCCNPPEETPTPSVSAVSPHISSVTSLEDAFMLPLLRSTAYSGYTYRKSAKHQGLKKVLASRLPPRTWSQDTLSG